METTPLTLLPTSRLPSIPVLTSDPRTHRISAQRLRPGVLYCDLLNFCHLPPQSKSETVCPLGINDLSSPCPAKVCEYVDPGQPFISTSIYYTASSLLPRQHVTEAGDGGRGGGAKWERGGKQKKAKRESKWERQRRAEGERDRDVKRGQEIEPRKDRLAASAALTEMSPLNGFPVLDAGPPYLISILLGSCSSDDLCRTQNWSLIKYSPSSR